MILLSKPLEIHELQPEAREELDYVCDVARERNGKTITGEEYNLSEDSFYRGVLLGDLISNIYTLSPPALRSRKNGSRIFVDKDPKSAIEYANYYATNERITKNFEEEQKMRGFKIPSGGAVLLEIQADKVEKVARSYAELHLPGIVVKSRNGLIYPHYLTENCKKYILEELGLDKDSFAYEIFFKEQLSLQF